MVSLGRKLKWPKTGHKWLYKHIRVVLCKKRFDERANIQKMRRFWKLAKMATMQGYSLPYMVSLGQRLKSPKTGQNWLYKLTRIVLSKKTLGKNWWYSNNETVWKIGKNGHSVKAITFAKRSVWVKDWNHQKRAKNDSTSTLELFYAKNVLIKGPIFEKWDDFENWQKWPLSKGYSLCKMVSLGRKLKWPKTGHKWLYKHIRVVLCKKRFYKRANIQKMRRFWKLAKMATMQGYSLPYMVSLGQRLKSPKTGQNWLYKLTRIILSKKTLGKNWWYSNNETVWKIGKNGHSVKAITFAKRSVWVKD